MTPKYLLNGEYSKVVIPLVRLLLLVSSEKTQAPTDATENSVLLHIKEC